MNTSTSFFKFTLFLFSLSLVTACHYSGGITDSDYDFGPSITEDLPPEVAEAIAEDIETEFDRQANEDEIIDEVRSTELSDELLEELDKTEALGNDDTELDEENTANNGSETDAEEPTVEPEEPSEVVVTPANPDANITVSPTFTNIETSIQPHWEPRPAVRQIPPREEEINYNNTISYDVSDERQEFDIADTVYYEADNNNNRDCRRCRRD